MSRLSIKTSTKKPASGKSLSEAAQCYLLIGIPLIGFLVFTIWPILWSVQKSWYFYDMISQHTRFVGTENFIKVFHDKAYWHSWLTTFEFAAIKIPLEILLTFTLSVILSKKMRGTGIFRSAYLLPNIISVAVVGVIFSNIFQYFGVANIILKKLHLITANINWFETSTGSMFVLITSSIWNTFGMSMLCFCTALDNVPNELYEAAQMDGADAKQKLLHITVPVAAPVVRTIILITITNTLQTGDFVIALTNGVPGGSTYTVAAYLINTFMPAFSGNIVNVGYGCAVGIINSLIYALIAFVFLKSSGKYSQLY